MDFSLGSPIVVSLYILIFSTTRFWLGHYHYLKLVARSWQSDILISEIFWFFRSYYMENKIVFKGGPPPIKLFWRVLTVIFVKTSLLRPPGVIKNIFPKICDFVFLTSRGRAHARVVGRISGAVTPIKLNFPGLFGTPKINLYFKF